MDINITLKNYRCFTTEAPAALSLSAGFTGFVGVNNAGKSVLLRSFYELRAIYEALAANTDTFRSILRGDNVPLDPKAADPEEIFNNENSADIELEICIPVAANSETQVNRATIVVDRKQFHWTARFSTASVALPPGLLKAGYRLESFLVRSSASGVVADFRHLFGACSSLKDAYYIPSFRHLTPFSPTAGSIGRGSTYFDINVGKPFIELWHTLQTGTLGRDRQRISRLVKEIQQVFGFKDLQVNASLGNDTLIFTIDGKTLKLEELGGGVAQFVVVLGNVALRNPTYICIDEPELNLHPSLQVRFLTKLAAYARDGVLFATHSLGLARSVADRVFSVHRRNGRAEVSAFTGTPRLAELVGELNYEGYRDLGFNKVLLVEGRTDVKTFIEFLRVLGKENEFLVVPVSDCINGNSHDELQELTRIAPSVHAVIDSERAAAADPLQKRRQDFCRVCEKLDISCHVLERRATDNYLSEAAVRLEFGDSHTAMSHFQTRTAGQSWSKTDNWKVARHMTREELLATDLGQFLSSI